MSNKPFSMIHPFRAFLFLVGALLVVGTLFYFLVFLSPIEASSIDEAGLVDIEETEEIPEVIPYVIPEVDLVKHQQAYDITITALLGKRKALQGKYNNAISEAQRDNILAEARQFLQKSLTESVFPAWYGTVWDFNGYTDSPRDGLIACGYFVSTPLKHIGFKLNRFKLAQQAALNIIKSLCPANDVHIIEDNDFESLLAYIESKPDNLYVVGLDNHVGFIEKKGGETAFIHSSYMMSSCGCVLREDARQSPVLPHSNIYVLGNISNNPALIKKWLLTEQVTIVKG